MLLKYELVERKAGQFISIYYHLNDLGNKHIMWFY